MKTKLRLFGSCEAVGQCPKPTVDTAPYHHFYWDAGRDEKRMRKIFERGRGHEDPQAKYGAVVCKTCGLKALVHQDAEDFPEI